MPRAPNNQILPPIDLDEGLMTITDVQADLGHCSRNTVLRAIASGQLDAVKMGRRTLVTRRSVRRRKADLPRAVLRSAV